MNESWSLEEYCRALAELIEKAPSDGLRFLTHADRERLLQNGKWRQLAGMCDRLDFIPVVRLVMPDAPWIFLLSEIDPSRPDIAYGLCDLGMGSPDMGDISITELNYLCGKDGLQVMRDSSFKPDRTLREYAERARVHGRIIV